MAAARRWLADVSGAPIMARWRVIVIEHADVATEGVQNALLKALEEPGERQLFILVADDVRRLLPTIRSRARPVRLGRVPLAALTELIAASTPATDEQAAALARLADGRVGNALLLADKPELVEWRRRVQQELIALVERGRAERMASVRELIDEAARLSPAQDRLATQTKASRRPGPRPRSSAWPRSRSSRPGWTCRATWPWPPPDRGTSPLPPSSSPTWPDRPPPIRGPVGRRHAGPGADP